MAQPLETVIKIGAGLGFFWLGYTLYRKIQADQAPKPTAQPVAAAPPALPPMFASTNDPPTAASTNPDEDLLGALAKSSQGIAADDSGSSLRA